MLGIAVARCLRFGTGHFNYQAAFPGRSGFGTRLDKCSPACRNTKPARLVALRDAFQRLSLGVLGLLSEIILSVEHMGSASADGDARTLRPQAYKSDLKRARRPGIH